MHIHELYTYALAEGEGVGTAYEYEAKRRVMAHGLAQLSPGDLVLVVGLPERYGTSLDFILAAQQRGARVLVVDERTEALRKAEEVLRALQQRRLLTGVAVEYQQRPLVGDGASLPRASMALSCEVMQRVPAAQQQAFWDSFRASAPRGVVFTPNSENGSHLRISGLGGFTRKTLGAVARGCEVGFADMPPFPPGIRRDESQRERASSGKLEAVAMRILDGYCALEPYLPSAAQAPFAHIVWARWS